MKVKLYRKFIKLVCKSLKISRKQLFEKDFNEHLVSYYSFDFETKKLIKYPNHLCIISYKHPLSQLWDSYCFHERWLFKHWRHSHWRPYVQMRIDLGENEDDVLKDILQNKDK